MTDSNTLGVSFRLNFNITEDSDSREALNLIELITPEPTYLPNNRSRPLIYLNRSIRRLADTNTLPNFSDNPNNDIDKDIISLKYGKSGYYLKGISKASALKANWKGFRAFEVFTLSSIERLRKLFVEGGR
ncbi:hypothetical protein N7530_010676 [Penicillium desertorum]|uniref:Uncharacterized protein n=1 Tax=Penicillium desertorum TaxID=1303715 RepID=A0A9X0BHS6_9EURO|nr:hypothetical protein N7530_010676 [Penicillium desertorum]